MGKDEDRDREDRRIFKRLNIVFRGRSLEWPVHHLKTFQKISVLGTYRYSTFRSDENRSNFWRSETTARAQHLVDTVSRLTRNQSSEMQWRLDIEKIVYKRFELGIKCPEPTCQERLWRSEIEAEPESSNETTRSLQKRRDDRAACSCSAEVKLKHQGSVGLNRIFDYRADEFIIHSGEARYALRPRKPDRVYGLQQTRFFTQALQAITAAMQDRITEDAEINENSRAFQFTPFEERARPLIFPFLISEAKTERGDSFDACERQTAFPVWILLRMQEELQGMSQQGLAEQGGPFVWFFANRGEEWRLYACFIDIEEYDKDHHTSYIIQDLWTGRLDSQDGALQILLLVDYIFDWARDIYRPGIARLLKLLLKNTPRKDIDDTESAILGTDFSSLDQKVVAWHDQMELDPPSFQRIQELEVPDLCYERSKEWQTTDTVTGAFRDPRIIETCFECVQFSEDIFSILLAPFITRGIAEDDLERFNLEIIDTLSSYAVAISDDTLGYLEEQWTGNRRLFDEAASGSVAKHAILVYYIHISARWQPRRVIACIMFGEDVIRKMQEDAGVTIRGDVPLREITADGVITIVQVFRRHTMKHNLIAAVESRSVIISNEPSRTTRQKLVGVLSPTIKIPALFQVLGLISSKDPRGSIEAITRFSSIVEYQKLNSTDARSTFFPPYTAYPLFASPHTRTKSLLGYRKSVEFGDIAEISGPNWCLFCLEPNSDVPDIEDQFNLIANICELDGFYITDYILSDAKSESQWQTHESQLNGGRPNVREALLQWKAMLEYIHTIKYLASLAKTESLALSESIKQTMSGREDGEGLGRFVSGLKSWDMFRIKREFDESN